MPGRGGTWRYNYFAWRVWDLAIIVTWHLWHCGGSDGALGIWRPMPLTIVKPNCMCIHACFAAKSISQVRHDHRPFERVAVLPFLASIQRGSRYNLDLALSRLCLGVFTYPVTCANCFPPAFGRGPMCDLLYWACSRSCAHDGSNTPCWAKQTGLVTSSTVIRSRDLAKKEKYRAGQL